MTPEQVERRRSVREVLRYARRMQMLMWLQLVVLVASAVVFSWSWFRTNDLAERNQQAIEVGCTLLRNAIIQSGAADDPAAGMSDQQKLTAIYITHIEGDLDRATRVEADRLKAKVVANGGVTIPDCRRIAQHPESVADVAKAAEAKAKRSR